MNIQGSKGIILDIKGPLSALNGIPKSAPYSAIRWQGNTPQVMVNGVWYELVAINDVLAAQIIEFQNANRDNDFRKHFDEDLFEIMSRMGHTPGSSVKLTLKTLVAQGSTITMNNVQMTAENRLAILKAGVQNAPK